jgi:hypothetical protein
MKPAQGWLALLRLHHHDAIQLPTTWLAVKLEFGGAGASMGQCYHIYYQH